MSTQQSLSSLRQFCFQEPLLVFPTQFMERLGSVPQVPRPWKLFDTDRRQKLLQLATLLLKMNANESTGRTVRYLLDLCNPAAQPPSVPAFPWISSRDRGEFDALIDLDMGGLAMGRMIPQMQFVARLSRRG